MEPELPAGFDSSMASVSLRHRDLTANALALIAVVTVLAGGVPARRASNVNPIDALRQQ